MPFPHNVSMSRRTVLGGLAASASAFALPAFGQNRPAGDIVLSGGSILSLDAARLYAVGDVHVRGGEIIAIANRLEIAGARRLDMSGRIVLPGLVDTHWHMWNSLARGFSMSKYGPFAKTMAPLSAVWTPEASALSVRLAAAEAINAGITTVNNWAHNTKSAEFAAAELEAMQGSGIRGRFSYGYPQSLKPDQKMDFASVEKLVGKDFGLIDLGICTRGPDRSAPAIWRDEWAFARQNKLPVTTHIASDRAAGAMGNIATMAKEGLLGADIQLVHATHATPEDFNLIRQAGSPLSISPWTEMQVGYGIPPIAAMAAAGVTMGLSVDNMVLSGNADMFAVMKVTADIAAGQSETQGKVSDATVLDWAIRGGAQSLGLHDRIGALKPGMRADVIAVRTEELNTVGSLTSEFLLTHAAQPQNVDLVMIDGAVHKQDGRLTSIDAGALTEEADAVMSTLRQKAGI